MAAKKKHVFLTVHTDVVKSLLRLHDTMSVVAAEVDQDSDTITFTVRAPDAPNGAVLMVPEYYHNGRPDPIVLRALTWVWPDGTTAEQQFGSPDGEQPETLKEAA